MGSMGIYKANAIQFGLQQLQDASSEILSSFIHWYYWSIHLSSLSLFYVGVYTSVTVSQKMQDLFE